MTERRVDERRNSPFRFLLGLGPWGVGQEGGRAGKEVRFLWSSPAPPGGGGPGSLDSKALGHPQPHEWGAPARAARRKACRQAPLFSCSEVPDLFTQREKQFTLLTR